MKKFYMSLLATLIAFATTITASATELKIVNMAIRESTGSPDGTALKNYLATNTFDFGVFDYAKGTTAQYFMAPGPFEKGGVNYYCAAYAELSSNKGFVIYNADKFDFVHCVVTSAKGASTDEYVLGVVSDKISGDQYAVFSCRGEYKDDKVAATLDLVKTKINNYKAQYPSAMFFVAYNARLSGTYSSTGNTYPDILNTYLTTTESGPHMTCLGRASVGGFYLSPEQVPTSYTVSDLADIGMKYTGTVVRVTVPTKHRVIFQDYDGTGLQTNVVAHGGSVTSPTPPEHPGFEFTGWDRTAEEFANVTRSFTATAQYQVSGNSHLVSYYSWDGEFLESEAVEDGGLCNPPAAPERLDYTFSCWTTNGAPFDITTPVKQDLDLTAAYTFMTVQETATAADFLRRIRAAYPTGTVIRLTADIDLEKASIAVTNFFGTLDGNGHSITGLKNNGNLFKYVYGTVKNLTFVSCGDGVAVRDNCSFVGVRAYGAVLENCVFTNCNVNAYLTNGGASLAFRETYAYGDARTVISNVTAVNCRIVNADYPGYDGMTIGGFVVDAKKTDFVNCRFVTDDGDVVSIGASVHAAGAIAGEALDACVFRGCYNNGKVVVKKSGDNYKGAGGIVGGANSRIELYGCTNLAAIVGAQQGGSGGIIARGSKCVVIIDGCVNRGSVTSQYGGTATNPYGIGAGGLIGGNWGDGSVIEVIDSVNYGDINTTTNNCHAGGLIGSFNNQGATLYITNAFNYGDVTSEHYAGGIVGYLYRHAVSINNLGNSGNVTSTGARAGGFAGTFSYGNNHASHDVTGFLNAGDIVGSNAAGLLIGGYEEILTSAVDTHIRLNSGILAGSVSATEPEGTTGTIMGSRIGSNVGEFEVHVNSECRVLQQGLFDYYTAEGGTNLETPITAMTAGDLTNGKAKKILNGNAEAYGVAPWIRGLNFPELSLFAKPIVGLQLIIR